MPGRTYKHVQEEVYSLFSLPKLPLEFLLIIYARQSAKDAPIRNKESYDMQTVELVGYGRELGWNDDCIIVKIENKRKGGKWRAASGTLRIDQREGLQSLVWLIEEDKCKAVMVWAVDRLFRHEDMVEPAVFVRICKEHHCIVLTRDDFFDFNNPKRDDRRRFLELAQQAADYVTKHVKGRMIPAKYKVARRGEYDGRTIPIGLVVFEGEKKPHEYTLQAEVVRKRIFARFRELGGQFNLLWREVAPVQDLFPPYPPDAIGVKSWMKAGPFGISRPGLEEMLTNIAYDGSWYFKEKGKSAIIIENNHDAIVPHDDFMFAFNRMSKTTLTGEPNEQRQMRPYTRFTRVGTDPYPALLDGIIDSNLPGYHVYVYEKPEKKTPAFYTLRGPEHAYLDCDRISVSVPLLDGIFEQRLEYHLRIFRALHALKEKSGSREQLEQNMLDYLRQVQQSISESNSGVASQLVQYREEAASLDKTLHFGAAALDGDTIIRYAARLAKLNTTIELLSKKDAVAEKAQEALRSNAQLLTDATISYQSMKFPKKQEFARLATTHIELAEIVPRWLKLTITWSPFLGTTPRDIAYIWRNSAGENWSEEEIDLLRQMYDEDRDDILRTLPKRTWRAIRRMAVRKGLTRHKQYLYSSLPEDMCYEDVRIMQEFSLEDSAEQRDVRVWWKKEAGENNATSPRT
jgi:hypothetical protein